jgi:rhamnose transport system permease protein
MKHLWRRESVLLLVLVVLCGLMACLSPYFLTVQNLFDLTSHLAEIGIIACGMTLIIMTGGIDLSVGSLLGLCVIVFGYSWQVWDLGVAPAIALTLLVGGLAGAGNGTLITRWNFPPLVVTLATMALFRGFALAISEAEPVSIPEAFWWVGQGKVGPVPVQLLFWLVIAAITAFLCYWTRLGRYAMAIGDNERAADFARLPVRRVKLLLYTSSGVLCALAAMIYAARFSTAPANAGEWVELAAITGVVLGGTSITGGRGSVWGTFLGIMILGVVRNGLDLAEVDAVWKKLVEGSILIATATANQLISEFAARAGARTEKT